MLIGHVALITSNGDWGSPISSILKFSEQMLDYQSQCPESGSDTESLSLPVAMKLNATVQLFTNKIKNTLEKEDTTLEEMQATEKMTERKRLSFVVSAVTTLARNLEKLCNKLGFDYLKSRVELSKEDLDKDMAQFTDMTDSFKRCRSH